MSETLRNKRVLWFDDDPGLRVVELDILRSVGAELTPILVPNEIIDRLDREDFDLAIIDIEMKKGSLPWQLASIAKEHKLQPTNHAGIALAIWLATKKQTIPLFFYSSMEPNAHILRTLEAFFKHPKSLFVPRESVYSQGLLKVAVDFLKGQRYDGD